MEAGSWHRIWLQLKRVLDWLDQETRHRHGQSRSESLKIFWFLPPRLAMILTVIFFPVTSSQRVGSTWRARVLWDMDPTCFVSESEPECDTSLLLLFGIFVLILINKIVFSLWLKTSTSTIFKYYFTLALIK